MAFCEHLIQGKRKQVLPRVQKLVVLNLERYRSPIETGILLLKRKNHLIIEFSGIF